MPTAASWTETRVDQTVRAVADVGHLLRFRAATMRRGVSAVAALLLLAAALAVAVVPAYLPGAGGGGTAFDLLVVLPTGLAGFLMIAIVSAAASGGGRELLARDPAGIHPISPTTDHLGALLLAPLNTAWLIQAWALLGVTAYAVGPGPLLPAQLVIVAWIAAGTALAQVLAWSLEGVRRTPHGIVGIRLLNVVVFGVAIGLQVSDRMIAAFDQIPTRWVVFAMLDGFTGRWAFALGGILAAAIVLAVLGAVPAHIAARRTPRDELKVESGRYPARASTASVLGAMVRIDRASVWRAVPTRRGVVVLALGPGIVAALVDLQWTSLTILPGLVASGGALLYGVNAWCLDGRGTLWRESLPVPAQTVFDARAYVLAEFLLVGSLLTVAVAAVRAGAPTPAELTALVAVLVVVTVQVAAAALRWSSANPFAVDLRSARATPAPPATMVAYSSRLAVSTTLTGLFFSALSRADDWRLPLLLAVPLLAWSTSRLLRTRRAWVDPPQRAAVVVTVAAA